MLSILSSSQPLREDWSAQNDEGIGGNLVLLIEPQLSLFQSMTMCTSDVKDADGVDLDLTLAAKMTAMTATVDMRREAQCCSCGKPACMIVIPGTRTRYTGRDQVLYRQELLLASQYIIAVHARTYCSRLKNRPSLS